MSREPGCGATQHGATLALRVDVCDPGSLTGSHPASKIVTCSCHAAWGQWVSPEPQPAALLLVRGCWAVFRAAPCWAQLWSLAALGQVKQAKIWNFGWGYQWSTSFDYSHWYYCLFHSKLLKFPLINIACPMPGSLPVNLRPWKAVPPGSPS